MGESYPATCQYCRRTIVREQVGWRSDERNLEVDRVRCPGSPEQEASKKKHQPAEQAIGHIDVQATLGGEIAC